MESRKQIAVNKWKSGLNCCQAVLLTYSDYFDIDETILFKISEGFGSGVSGLRRTCGALLAAVMIAGLVNSDGDIANPKTKHQTYAIGQELINDFEKKYNTSMCNDLKGLNTGKIILPCNLCIEEACNLIEKKLLVNRKSNHDSK